MSPVVAHETKDEGTEICIKLLVAYGARSVIKDNKGESPIDVLLDKNKQSAAQILITLTCKYLFLPFYGLEKKLTMCPDYRPLAQIPQCFILHVQTQFHSSKFYSTVLQGVKLNRLQTNELIVQWVYKGIY